MITMIRSRLGKLLLKTWSFATTRGLSPFKMSASRFCETEQCGQKKMGVLV